MPADALSPAGAAGWTFVAAGMGVGCAAARALSATPLSFASLTVHPPISRALAASATVNAVYKMGNSSLRLQVWVRTGGAGAVRRRRRLALPSAETTCFLAG